MYYANEDRYEKMRYAYCGNSGLKLPLVSLGLWHNFGDHSNLENMKEIIFTAFDNGITHFDLANNYGPAPGSAEKNFGIILKEDMGKYRDELLISTETCGALAQIVNSGKALYVGLSNYDGETLEQAAKILSELHVPFIINQNRYSIFDRTVENNGLKDMSAKLNKGIISFSPLAQGLLTDRYLNGVPSDSRIATDGRFLKTDNLTEKKLNAIRELNEMAKSREQSLAQMALAWVLKDGIVTSVLIGASKAEQVLDNIAAIKNTKFSDEELKKIDKIVKDNE